MQASSRRSHESDACFAADCISRSFCSVNAISGGVWHAIEWKCRASNSAASAMNVLPVPVASLAPRLGLRPDLPRNGRDGVPTYENSFLQAIPSLSVARSGRPLCL